MIFGFLRPDPKLLRVVRHNSRETATSPLAPRRFMFATPPPAHSAARSMPRAVLGAGGAAEPSVRGGGGHTGRTVETVFVVSFGGWGGG